MRRRRSLAIGVLLALLLVASNVFQNILAGVGWDRVKDHPLVAKYGVPLQILFVLLFAVAFVLWEASRGAASHEGKVTDAAEIRRRLVERVLEFAQSQFDGGLYAKARVEFQIAERPLVVSDSDRPLERSIDDYYRASPGPLVILGRPGTGKSTLLYELAALVASDDDAEPVPLPVNLANWAQQRDSLTDWLGDEFVRHYGVSRALAVEWIRLDRITPFLDGLDEVDPSQRKLCITRINEYRVDHPRVKLVITCREEEYLVLQPQLNLASILVVKPLEALYVRSFLDSNRQKFEGLCRALAFDPILIDFIDTPLMLWVAAFAFRNHDRPDDDDAIPARERLFQHYVDEMITRDRSLQVPGSDPISLEHERRRLRNLAQCMTRASIVDFRVEEISLRWLRPNEQTTAVWIMAALAILATGLLTAPLGWDLGLQLAIMALLGLCERSAGMLVRFQRRLDITRIPVITLLNISARPLLNIAIAMAIGSLSLALIMTVVVRFSLGALPNDSWLGTILTVSIEQAPFVLLVGTIAALIRLVDAAQRLEMIYGRPRTEDALKKAFAEAVLAYAATMVLHISWRAASPAGSLSLEIAAFVAFFFLGGGFCLKNLAVRLTLWHYHSIPLRFERFLHSSVRRLLMSRQGGSLRFVHRLIQEHLVKQSGEWPAEARQNAHSSSAVS